MADYLQKTLDLARKSLDAGGFPAGAVLVTKSGTVYESNAALARADYHGETMVIDAAVEAEGAPLAGAVLYGTYEPCLMCSAKMYWAGVTSSHFIIPKSEADAAFVYEDAQEMQQHLGNFFTQITKTNDSALLGQALQLYASWHKKITNNS